MRVYKMGPKGLNQCIEEDPLMILEWINNDADIGEVIEITIMEMSKEEYDKLPEYMGP